MKITAELLATAGPKGKYLVAALRQAHEGIPAGTVGLVEGAGANCLVIFPAATLPEEKLPRFAKGHFRIVPFSNLKPLGRVG